MSVRCLLVCATVFLVLANGADAARFQRTKDGKTIIWNNLRGVAQDATWSGLRDTNGYATGEGTLTWYRLGEVVNSYTGKMVHGKFEGPVVREQGTTRLQATFVNGENTRDWSEPESIESRTPTPPPKLESPKPESPEPTATSRPEETVEEILPTPIPLPSALPSRFPTPRPTPTFTPAPIAKPPTTTPTPSPIATLVPTPTPTATPTPTPSPTPSPTPTPKSTPTPMPTAILTPPQLKSLTSPTVSESTSPQLEELVEKPGRDSLKLETPAPGVRDALEEVPAAEKPMSSPVVERSASSPPATVLPQFTGSKAQMIAQFKKQIESVLGQVREATGNFREIEQIDNRVAFPAAVSGSIAALAERSRDFHAKLGYEVAVYECGAETATVDALVAVDEVLHDWTQKNAPAARLRLVNFFKRYPSPLREDQKPLWRYNGSMLIAFNKVKREAESHLQKAKSLEAAGKQSDALREYQEIYRIYPNTITADKIKLLENPPH